MGCEYIIIGSFSEGLKDFYVCGYGEMVDALDSGSSRGSPVEVQILLAAPRMGVQKS